MSGRRQEQVGETLMHLAAQFLERESESSALITVTRIDISPDLKNATIFLSVLPESSEASTLQFAKRERSEFRQYVRSHSRLHYLPLLDFELDYGEKNRQRIDDLTRK